MKQRHAQALTRTFEQGRGNWFRLSVFALILAIAALFASGASARTAPFSFADLAEELSPAVVNISTSQMVDRPSFGPAIPDLPPGSPFEELFKDFFERRGQQNDVPRKVQSLGSGFVIDPLGFVVTNNHVIEDADEIVINFADGSSAPAKLVGTDPKTDIAVLELTEKPDEPLKFVKFGDSDAARVGDWVMAIGNPFGLGGSVSAGIISARNRDINSGPYDDFLQTDAAINRGNSGGPLFDMDGKVIGVNTAIYSPTGGSVGVGFAVPANIAANVVMQLREYGETRRGWIGVRIRPLTDELAEGLDLDDTRGALVEDVTEDGPASEAGVEIGDVILSFDGTEIDEMRALPRAVAATSIDETVRMVVWRKGKTVTLKVTVGLLEEPGRKKTAKEPEDGAVAEPEASIALGMKLENLTQALREKYSIDQDQMGVLITEVDSRSVAAKKGLQRGDVIVEVAQEPVSDPADVVAAIDAEKAAEKKSVLFLISRGGDVRFVALRFEGE